MELVNINSATMAGEIITEPTIYESHNEKFLNFQMRVERKSGNTDTVCVNASELLVGSLKVGDKVCFDGEIRSYNKQDGDGKSHLVIMFFVLDVYPYTEPINHIEIAATVCKEPCLRITPFNREICDLLVAVNRKYGHSSYLPCIVWGRKARFASHIAVGTQVSIEGRFQSREYTKKHENGTLEQKTAYEISVSRIIPINEVL